jgi:hypothetical protein
MLMVLALLAAPRASADPLSSGSTFGDQFDDGNIQIWGSNDGSGGPPGGSNPDDSQSAISETRTMEMICADLDPETCRSFHQIYCVGMPIDDVGNRWRVVMTYTVQRATGLQVGPISYSCANLAAVPEVDPGPSEADVREYLEQVLPAPRAGTNPVVSPTTGMIETLVNLPLILHVDDPTAFDPPPGTLIGHQVTVSATASEFTWSVGAQTITTTDLGTAWSGAYSCTVQDCSPYLHADGVPAAGQYSVQLATEWTARYRVDDGPWLDIAEPLVKTSPVLTLNAREARSVLVSGDE